MASPYIDLELTALLAVMLLASIVSRKARVPYTLILVILGILIAIPTSISTYTRIPSLYTGLLGTSFVALILPPLLFESMMNIRSSELKTSIRPAILLATVGVLLSTIVGGLLLWKLAGLPRGISFLFASLISPTDTASVLEIFKRMRVPRRLAALMDAEAAFNDATGTILFTLIYTYGSFIGLPLVPAAMNFALVLGGGIVIGLAVGFGAELISSIVSDSLSETVLSVSMVYGSYFASTAFHFSGLISVAVTGLYYGNLTLRTSVRPLSREQVRTFWGVIAFIANSLAFLFIGLNTKLQQLYSSLNLVIIAYGSVIVARFAAVYPLMTFFGRSEEKTARWRNVAVLGGMRGALSVALVASIQPSYSTAVYQMLVAMVLGVVFISIALQGPVLSAYIKRRFPEEAPEAAIEPTMRLSEALRAIEDLYRLRLDGKLTESQYAERLEDARDRLAALLSEINSSLRTGEIMKSRAKEVYSSLTAISRTRAMEILKRNQVDEPIDELIHKGEEELGGK